MTRKRYPPFGKRLTLMRQIGKVPSKVVMVVFNWKLGAAYPRIIITEDTNTETLEFGYLSGIPVQIVYCSQDANPSYLSTFALDLAEIGKATTILKPLQNTTHIEEEVCV